MLQQVYKDQDQQNQILSSYEDTAIKAIQTILPFLVGKKIICVDLFPCFTFFEPKGSLNLPIKNKDECSADSSQHIGTGSFE